MKWWTPELTSLKKGVHKLRREYQKAKRQKDKLIIRNKRALYLKEQARYKLKARECRKSSWEKFVSEATKEPWGFAYKLSCNKLRGKTVISSMQKGGLPTTDWRNQPRLFWRDSLWKILNRTIRRNKLSQSRPHSFLE